MDVKGVFVYGTLRPDYTTKGDHWGVVDETCDWKYAKTKNYKIFQEPNVFYPFAMKSFKDEIIYGIVLTWKDDKIFEEKLKVMDGIEGYSENSLENWYERGVVECETKSGEMVKCFIYYQKENKNLEDCIQFDSGNWLGKY
jgi:gamma-glutamylcyclotransferase (GGCT)/AIG2-like uncharacterized protein YtfP